MKGSCIKQSHTGQKNANATWILHCFIHWKLQNQWKLCCQDRQRSTSGRRTGQGLAQVKGYCTSALLVHETCTLSELDFHRTTRWNSQHRTAWLSTHRNVPIKRKNRILCSLLAFCVMDLLMGEFWLCILLLSHCVRVTFSFFYNIPSEAGQVASLFTLNLNLM